MPRGAVTLHAQLIECFGDLRTRLRTTAASRKAADNAAGGRAAGKWGDLRFDVGLVSGLTLSE